MADRDLSSQRTDTVMVSAIERGIRTPARACRRADSEREAEASEACHVHGGGSDHEPDLAGHERRTDVVSGQTGSVKGKARLAGDRERLGVVFVAKISP